MALDGSTDPATGLRQTALFLNMKLKESEIQKAIAKDLNMHPKVAHAIRSNAGGFLYHDTERNKKYKINLAPKGFPDISGMLKGGQSFYVEVKRSEKQKPDKDQLMWHERIRSNGGLVFVAWNSAMVWEWLESLTLEKS